MDRDPVTGPISREKLRELAAAPCGQARKEIQKIDPFWGIPEGEKIEFEIICEGKTEGRAYVKAASQKEADSLAGDLSYADVDWDIGPEMDEFDVISVKPYKRRTF